MCCATGVCGPSVKKELIQTTAIQRHVNADGENIIIRRNLTQNPDAFGECQECCVKKETSPA